MAVLNTGLAKTSATGYTIDYSCRFEDGDTPSLSRTPGSAGNRLLWTYSTWMKRGNQGGYRVLFASKTNSSSIFITPGGKMQMEQYSGAGGIYDFRKDWGTAKLRDSSAWYHALFIYDSAQDAADDRIKFYLNNVLQTKETETDVIAEDFESEFNNTEEHWIGRLGSW